MKTLFMWLAVVLVLSVYPFEGVRAGFLFADKALHFIIYAITCALFYTVLKESRRPHSMSGIAGAGVARWKVSVLLLSVVLTSVYGLLMEVMQGFVTARSFSLWDGVTNTLGAVSAAVYINITVKRRRR